LPLTWPAPSIAGAGLKGSIGGSALLCTGKACQQVTEPLVTVTACGGGGLGVILGDISGPIQICRSRCIDCIHGLSSGLSFDLGKIVLQIPPLSGGVAVGWGDEQAICGVYTPVGLGGAGPALTADIFCYTWIVYQ